MYLSSCILSYLTLFHKKKKEALQDTFGCFLILFHRFLLPFTPRQIIDLSRSQSGTWSLAHNLLLIQQEKTNGAETAASRDLLYLFLCLPADCDCCFCPSPLHQPMIPSNQFKPMLWNSCEVSYVFDREFFRSSVPVHVSVLQGFSRVHSGTTSLSVFHVCCWQAVCHGDSGRALHS